MDECVKLIRKEFYKKRNFSNKLPKQQRRFRFGVLELFPKAGLQLLNNTAKQHL